MSLPLNLTQGWTQVSRSVYMIALGGQVNLELRSARRWDDKAGRYATSWRAVAVRTTYHPMSWGGGTSTTEVTLATGLRVSDLMASLSPVVAASVEARLRLLVRHVWPKTAPAVLMDWAPTRDRVRDILDADAALDDWIGGDDLLPSWEPAAV